MYFLKKVLKLDLVLKPDWYAIERMVSSLDFGSRIRRMASSMR